MGHRRSSLRTHVTVLEILLSKEGGNHPFGFVRLAKRGFRKRVWRCLLLRRIARRSSSAALMACPRWKSSAAKTTSPLASLTMASPVVLLPGSILRRNGSSGGDCSVHFNMIVNGYRLNTAAFPDESKMRALPGCTGASGRFFVSSTNTLLNLMLLRASACAGKGGLVNVSRRHILKALA